MRKRVTLVLALLPLLCMVGCRKESEDFSNPNGMKSQTYLAQFDAVWQGMNQSYMFWSEDTVDWDARYDKYHDVFAAFDSRPSSKPVTQSEYQAAWDGLFSGILDHHLTGRFYSSKDRIEAWVSPGSSEVYARQGYHWTDRSKQLKALKLQPGIENYYGFEPASINNSNIPGSYFCLLPGKEVGKYIAYFRFTNFYFNEMVSCLGYMQPSDQVSAQMPVVSFYGERYYEGVSGTRGWANRDEVESLIIDVRGNGGGDVSDLMPIIGSLTQGNTHVGYTRVKEGLGRLDLSAWTQYYVKMPDKHLSKQKPIVLLADMNSVSCAELATLVVKNLPNGTVIGERTWGGMGALWPNSDSMHDVFYNGCFGDYDYWQYGATYATKTFAFYVYTSTFQFVDKDHVSLEGHGIEPDIEVPYDEVKLRNGVDTQMERALQFLRTGR